MATSQHLSYSKLRRPSSCRNSVWNHFGFPSNSAGTILTRSEIICCLCYTPFTYSKDSSELQLHLVHEHPEVTIKTGIHSDIQSEPVEDSNTALTMGNASEEGEDELFVYDDDEDQIEYLIDNTMEIEVEEDAKAALVQSKPLRTGRVKQYDDISQGLAEMCIEDLISPVIVDGLGFSRWIQKLKPNALLPAKEQVNIKCYFVFNYISFSFHILIDLGENC